MRRTICFCVVAFIALILLSESASGCSCAGGGSPCQAYGSAAAVFTGTVIAVRKIERPKDFSDEEYWGPVTFRFSVEQSFLGIEGREVDVSTGQGGGDCGYGFKVGERYLVYADRNVKNNRLTTSICSRTTSLSKAKEDLEFLRNLPAMAPGVTISGAVYRHRDDIAAGDRTKIGPMANIQLTVEEAGFRKEIRTDAEGRFQLSALSPGTIKVAIALPDQLTAHKNEEEITLGDRGCGTMNFFVIDNGRISGSVFDAEGQPVARVSLTLMEADKADPTKYYSKVTRTDDRGSYSFSGVSPGRYVMAVNLTRFPEFNDETNAYPRTFFPGVSTVSEAEVIAISAGEELREKDLRLPHRRPPSVITGKVVWDDGQPVPKATVTMRDVTYHDPGLDNAISTDEQGYFTINCYMGQTFLFSAYTNAQNTGDQRTGPMGRAAPFRITLANPTEMVKIVITRLK